MRIPARFLLGLSTLLLAAPRCPAHTPAEEMGAAAKNLLDALSNEQQEKAVYEFKNEERFDWHFIPKPRKGLPIGEMTTAQRALAEALLSSGLSQRGFAKASTIMSLEQVLFDLENKAPHRNADLYYFTVFGKPGPEPWGWRVEGHHLSLNFAVRGDEVLGVTPSFFGANPGRVEEGPRKGLRVFAEEEDLGRQLVKSLSAEQARTAIITNIAPNDIITSHDRAAHLLTPAGIAASKLDGAQKELLHNLLKEYLFRYRAELAEPDLKKIEAAGEDKLHFAWAGSTEPGKGHYYRIQGATFLMEYDNTQNNANHVHTVWRDLENDFGGDLLRSHYDSTPHSK